MEKESGKRQRQRKNDQNNLSLSTDGDPPDQASGKRCRAWLNENFKKMSTVLKGV